jgi:hypothetical protein
MAEQRIAMQSFAILQRNLGLEAFLIMIELSFVTGLSGE